MPQIFDMILKNATVVNHDGVGKRDIGIYNGHIAALGNLSRASAGEVIDCIGLHIVPGIIDSQVHFREPGFEYKENFETGSLAAVLGGVTSVFDMPNTNPPTASAEMLIDKVTRARHRMHCDFAFWIGGTRENAHELSELERLSGVAGIKVFMGSSTGNLLVDDDIGVRTILKNRRRRVAVHSEDNARLIERQHLCIENDASSHPIWRDEVTSLRSTERLVRIARETGTRVHILHVSTAEEISFLKDHKDLATLEVTPHHLTLSTDDYARLGTLMQINPPIRSNHHRHALWFGLQQGIVDVIGSDHAPHILEEKKKSYPSSPSGITGVQTIAPIMLDHVNSGKLTLEAFVDLTSHGPNRIFGISRKGRIAIGYDADLTVIDLKRRETITNAREVSKVGWTPYDGRKVIGWPIGTIIRGHRIMWEGEIITSSKGKVIDFIETLPHC
ncbi:MAG: dihydroorotase [Candidatus Tokpelaia sp. JSC188]|nr:MAG: dihydroorotase [Candidatus Tokpelaia sp. JSC188]